MTLSSGGLTGFFFLPAHYSRHVLPLGSIPLKCLIVAVV